MKDTIRASVAEQGERVTTHNKFGGMGLGYIVDGIVYMSSGNGWYQNAETNVFPLDTYDHDNGDGYLNQARKLTGWKI